MESVVNPRKICGNKAYILVWMHQKSNRCNIRFRQIIFIKFETLLSTDVTSVRQQTLQKGLQKNCAHKAHILVVQHRNRNMVTRNPKSLYRHCRLLCMLYAIRLPSERFYPTPEYSKDKKKEAKLVRGYLHFFLL